MKTFDMFTSDVCLHLMLMMPMQSYHIVFTVSCTKMCSIENEDLLCILVYKVFLCTALSAATSCSTRPGTASQTSSPESFVRLFARRRPGSRINLMFATRTRNCAQ